jgi:hypothetical protein
VTAVWVARVAGTNAVRVDSHDWDWLDIFPSVTNTGPQGLYVYHIIQRAWEDMGRKRTWDEAEESVTKLGELKSMVISFDKDGNPVSSVVLAKYGLSMPVIEPKPAANNSRDTEYTVTFPHDTKGWTPPKSSDGIPAVEGGGGFQPPEATDTPQRQDAVATLPNRPWLHIAIAFLALLGGTIIWRKTKRK